MLNMLQCCKSLAFRPKAFFRVILTCRIFILSDELPREIFRITGFRVFHDFLGRLFVLRALFSLAGRIQNTDSDPVTCLNWIRISYLPQEGFSGSVILHL